MVFAALGIVVILGAGALSVDMGLLVATRNRLQQACDAAALSAAQELPATSETKINSATSFARQTMEQNGVSTSETTVTFPTTSRIQVTATRRVGFLFAPILGLTSKNVTTTAIAGRMNLAGIPYAVPLAITTDDYNASRDGRAMELLLVDNNRQDFVSGTLTALDLRNDTNGKSVDGFEEDLKFGWHQPIYFNQQINSTLNASLVSQYGAMNNAIQSMTAKDNSRFYRAAQAPWNDLVAPNNGGQGGTYTYPNYGPSGNPRIVTLIVADPNPANNSNPMLNARNFAPVYIENFVGKKGETYVRMRILPELTYSSEDPNVVVGDESTTYSGLSVIKLLG